ncbi:hypothetical protein [Micromonospora chersina]|uniref:hypothetical protein n=1 Tax=Micromonospora chersina TaxID=47854 RepID=UPI0033BB03DB
MLVISDIKSFALPLDAYKAIGDQNLAIDRARNALVVECMARFGFQVQAPELTPIDFAQNQKRYGITDPERAAQFGYREPEIDQRQRPEEPELSLEAQAVIRGEGQKTSGGQQVPDGGCIGEAARELKEGGPSSADPEMVVSLEVEARKRAEKDSRVRKVFSDWSTCMKASGYEYSGPMNANDDPTFQTPVPSEREIGVAKADVECKRRTNLVNVWASVEAAYQQRLIERNQGALDQVKRSLRLQLTKAAQINQA